MLKCRATQPPTTKQLNNQQATCLLYQFLTRLFVFLSSTSFVVASKIWSTRHDIFKWTLSIAFHFFSYPSFTCFFSRSYDHPILVCNYHELRSDNFVLLMDEIIPLDATVRRKRFWQSSKRVVYFFVKSP